MKFLINWIVILAMALGFWLLLGHPFSWVNFTGLAIVELPLTALYLKIFTDSWTGRS